MPLLYRFVVCVAFLLPPVFHACATSDDEADGAVMIWGGSGKRAAPMRPEIVPPLVLTTLEHKEVDSPRSVKAASDLRASQEAFEAITWGAKDTQQALCHLFSQVTGGVGNTWETPIYQRSFKRLAVRVLLRLLADPLVTFPVRLNGYERTQLRCANQAYALALSTGCPDLCAKASIAFVQNTQEQEIYFRGTTRTKSEVLFEAYCGLQDRKRLTKAKVLMQLLKHWDHTPHLRGDEHFTRQDCVETLFDLTQGRRFPMDLRYRIYRTILAHWDFTHAFLRGEKDIDPAYLGDFLRRTNTAKAGLSLASHASSSTPVGAPPAILAPKEPAYPPCLFGIDPILRTSPSAFPHARL